MNRKKSLIVFTFLFCLLLSSCAISLGAGATGWAQVYKVTTSEDYSCSVVQTSDGGFALAGTAFREGERLNFWLAKVDSSGKMQWNKTFGGQYDDYAYAVVQTNDGGYAVAGKLSHTRLGGDSDYWLVKTDSLGNMQWNQTYDGKYDDFAYSMVKTSDGGYALVGSAHFGGYVIWLVKTDSSGKMMWDQRYGESGDNFGYAVTQTSDGGYAIGGRVGSQLGANGSSWLVKTDSSGNTVWSQKYGGEGINSVVQASDGGYAVTGSMGPQQGQDDTSFIKTDASGNVLWSQTGGASDLIKTNDGGYAYHWGGTLVKTDSSGNAQWVNDFGRIETDASGGNFYTNDFADFITDSYKELWINSLVQTSDGGFAVTGYAPKGPGYFLIKTDEAGVVPEFPSLLAIPLLLALAVIAAMVYRRKTGKAPAATLSL